MTNRIIVALLQLLPVMATGEGQSTLPLTLGCSGTALNGHTNTNITDLSIVVDFDRHTVSGFFQTFTGSISLTSSLPRSPVQSIALPEQSRQAAPRSYRMGIEVWRFTNCNVSQRSGYFE